MSRVKTRLIRTTLLAGQRIESREAMTEETVLRVQARDGSGLDKVVAVEVTEDAECSVHVYFMGFTKRLAVC